jgi:hypothetical protein
MQTPSFTYISSSESACLEADEEEDDSIFLSLGPPGQHIRKNPIYNIPSSSHPVSHQKPSSEPFALVLQLLLHPTLVTLLITSFPLLKANTGFLLRHRSLSVQHSSLALSATKHSTDTTTCRFQTISSTRIIYTLAIADFLLDVTYIIFSVNSLILFPILKIQHSIQTSIL